MYDLLALHVERVELPHPKALMAMPGIRKVTVMTILAEIGKIWRLKSAWSLCNWISLTPRVRKSDAIVRHGNISKQGSAYLRSAMGQVAMVTSRSALAGIVFMIAWKNIAASEGPGLRWLAVC
jgi:transposase